MLGHYPYTVLFFSNSFLYVIFTHFNHIYLLIRAIFFSFVKGCSLAAESLFLTKIFNQRTLQLFKHLDCKQPMPKRQKTEERAFLSSFVSSWI